MESRKIGRIPRHSHEDEEQAVKLAEGAIGTFTDLYHELWLAGMRAKLGIFHEEEDDESLIEGLLKMMKNHQADYTNTFRALTFDKLEDTPLNGTSELASWYERWQARIGDQQESKEQSHQLMRANPAVIPGTIGWRKRWKRGAGGDYSVMGGSMRCPIHMRIPGTSGCYRA